MPELGVVCQSRQKTLLVFLFEQNSNFPASSRLEIPPLWCDNDFDALNSPLLFPFQGTHHRLSRAFFLIQPRRSKRFLIITSRNSSQALPPRKKNYLFELSSRSAPSSHPLASGRQAMAPDPRLLLCPVMACHLFFLAEFTTGMPASTERAYVSSGKERSLARFY